MPAIAWLYVCCSVATALIGMAVWKHGFPYSYLQAGSWWASIIAGLLVVLFIHSFPIFGALRGMILYAILTGIGVGTLSQGILDLIDKARKIGR